VGRRGKAGVDDPSPVGATSLTLCEARSESGVGLGNGASPSDGKTDPPLCSQRGATPQTVGRCKRTTRVAFPAIMEPKTHSPPVTEVSTGLFPESKFIATQTNRPVWQ
jgi:hypothetical protein